MEGGGGKLSPSDGTEISDSNELTDKIVLALSTDKGCDEGYIVEGSGIVMDATSVTVDAENGPKITVPVDKTSGTFSFSFETTALGRVGLTAF
jgi:hypothetical protein